MVFRSTLPFNLYTMPNLKEVKNRISSVMSTQQITKAMKMVAAAKLRRAQDAILQMRPYAEKLNGILQNVSSGSSEESENGKYNQEREVKNVLIVAVTSDRGLCGAFNANVVKGVNALIEEKYQEQLAAGAITILPIGKKAYDSFKRLGFSLKDDFYEMYAALSFEKVRVAAEFAMDSFVAGGFDKVDVVYNEFKNVATQIIRTEQFLPIEKAEVEDNDSAFTSETDYLYEPNKEEIENELIPKSLKIQLYKAVLESNASEHGARMTAMDKATENAGELLHDLKLTYNRTRQAAITKEILEIVAGAEALG